MSLSDDQLPGVHVSNSNDTFPLIPTQGNVEEIQIQNFETVPNVPEAIVIQPTSAPEGYWTDQPPLYNCPPGLEYLATIDQLLIHQKVELLEIITGFETNNKYTIKNILGQKVYYAIEDNDCCTRNCCGPLRPFDMKIFDNFRNEVIHLYRPFACQGCCFPCCMQTIEISSPPGTVIGTVEEEWKCIGWKFAVKNEFKETVLRINGPCCPISCFSDVNFYITSADGETNLGKITKQWTGLVREMFTDADNFGITFPIDLDIKTKALLLGACFLIDFMFFERASNN
ncbi:hypothetical protein Zmor_002984 [Zophobas morio]|uniref:Phospholipid scramblase n=1 Tax=Zophobas morio TaxID=2755281 RepID=A0AA38M1L1_9CUCU|nr:hypothetical protein Zmor_002984 [Zophobas morio]